MTRTEEVLFTRTENSSVFAGREPMKASGLFLPGGCVHVGLARQRPCTADLRCTMMSVTAPPLKDEAALRLSAANAAGSCKGRRRETDRTKPGGFRAKTTKGECPKRRHRKKHFMRTFKHLEQKQSSSAVTWYWFIILMPQFWVSSASQNPPGLRRLE